jgi:hypothetical protein
LGVKIATSETNSFGRLGTLMIRLYGLTEDEMGIIKESTKQTINDQE